MRLSHEIPDPVCGGRCPAYKIGHIAFGCNRGKYQASEHVGHEYRPPLLREEDSYARNPMHPTTEKEKKWHMEQEQRIVQSLPLRILQVRVMAQHDRNDA